MDTSTNMATLLNVKNLRHKLKLFKSRKNIMSMFKRKDPSTLAAQLDAMKPTSFNESDKKEWKAKTDTAGNGSWVIRFLPARDDNSSPFIYKVTHFFQGTGKKYYSEACTSTHGDYDSCPVCQYISDNNLYETDKKMYGKLSRSHSYWANILVIKDPTNAENDGKIFKYRFGQKIMDKINAEIKVDTSIGEIPVDVTCLFGGKNFVLKIKQVSGHNNYDECKFLQASELPNINDETYQKYLVDEMSDLNELVAPSVFKSLEENTKSFQSVFGTLSAGGAGADAAKQAGEMESELENFQAEMNNFNAGVTEAPPKQQEDIATSTVQTQAAPADDVDGLLGELGIS